MSNLVRPKDSQWLQVDVCREFQQGHCPRADDACKYAHPGPKLEITDGKVMACYDSCKGRCNRDVCKFYHPNSIIVEQLLLKGRNQSSTNDVSNQRLNQPVFVPLQGEAVIPFPTFEPQSLRTEVGVKRSADVLSDNVYQTMYRKRPAMEIPLPFFPFTPPIFQFPAPSETTSVIPLNASFVNYTDSNGQLLDNLIICQDFNRNLCTRINCKFVHLLDPKKLEINDQRVAVCRDHANGLCRRQQCKYYHIPIAIPPASEVASHFPGI